MGGGNSAAKLTLKALLLLILLPFPATAAPLAYVTNEVAGTITIFDTATNQVVSTVPMTPAGARPRGVQLTADGRRLYVALSDLAHIAKGPADAVVALDAKTFKEVQRFDVGTDPERFIVTRDGSRLYSANEDAGTATVTGVRKNKVIASLVVGIEPEGVALSPDGRWVYVTAETSNTVSVIDTRSLQVVTTFLVDPRPRVAAFSPDGKKAYVTAEVGGTMAVVDALHHKVLRTIKLPPRSKPVGVVVSPDGRRLYTANGLSGDVSVIDTATLKVIATIPAGKGAWGVVIGR